MPDSSKSVKQLIAEILPSVQVSHLESLLKDLTGENEITLDGVVSRILSRNTFTSGLELAARYIEKYYAGLKIATTRHEYEIGDITAPNIIAEIPGDLTPEKIIVVGSHFDSTIDTPKEAEPEAPGADDDATGTIACMEVARAIMALKAIGVKFACTIRFIHFSGEEQKRRGSIAYVRTLKELGAWVATMFQLEMMGYTSDGSNQIDLHDDGNAEAHKLALSLMDTPASYGLKLKTVNRYGHFPGRPSDHWSFSRAGFPAICICEDSFDQELNPVMHTLDDRVSALQLNFFVEAVRFCIVAITNSAGLVLP